MSQPIELDEQRSYQAPTGYSGVLYQGQPAYPGVTGRPPEQAAIQPNASEATTSRHRLILAVCSQAALAAAVIAFISALETDPIGSIPLFALLGLAVVSASIVAINVTFHLRR
jgi:hypothetical protein